MYGVIGADFANSGVPDGIWLTLQERGTGMPDHLVVVGATGTGEHYVLDISRADASGECPIVIWGPGGSEPGDELEHIAGDFGTFLLERLQEEDW